MQQSVPVAIAAAKLELPIERRLERKWPASSRTHRWVWGGLVSLVRQPFGRETISINSIMYCFFDERNYVPLRAMILRRRQTIWRQPTSQLASSKHRWWSMWLRLTPNGNCSAIQSDVKPLAGNSPDCHWLRSKRSVVENVNDVVNIDAHNPHTKLILPKWQQSRMAHTNPDWNQFALSNSWPELVLVSSTKRCGPRPWRCPHWKTVDRIQWWTSNVRSTVLWCHRGPL